MLLWHTASDRIEPGQWLIGRVYEHRCDLSPNGQLFVYFAAKHKPPLPAWSAVSRPPYFTALALWPNIGTYGGGGLFDSDRRLLLNHRNPALADDFSVPKSFDVQPLGAWAGRGEDHPIASQRLLRDGWTNTTVGASRNAGRGDGVSRTVDPPDVWERPHPHRKKAARIRLRRSLTGIHVEDGPWYRVDFDLVVGEKILRVENAEWADFDARGDLVFAADGRLYRAPGGERIDRAVEVADLREHQFESVPPPPWATQWP